MNYFIRLSVLGLALLQVVSGYIITVGSSSSLLQGGVRSLISPTGYAFSIWALIVAGCVAYAFYQLVSKRNRQLYQKLAPWAVVVFAGYSVWLYAAGKEWLWGTVGIFLLMGYALYRISCLVGDSAHEKKLSVLELLIVQGTFGLYAGWATVAIFANAAASFVASGAPLTGAVGIFWQGVALVGATIVAMLGIRVTRYSIPYFTAVCWAYVAIFIGLLEQGSLASYLPWVCALAGILLAVFYLRKK